MSVFEQPLNEKTRLFLRLELLVRRFRYHLEKEDACDNLAALMLLLDLSNLTSRIDLKSDVIMEIDRTAQSVRQIIGDVGAQDETLTRLTDFSNILYQLRGSLGQNLRSNNFFSQLRQRASLPGGLNNFDIPLLNYWLDHDPALRKADLQRWGEGYMNTSDAVEFLLGLIRTYCAGEEHVAKEGFFQMTMPRSYQLLQVILPERSTIYPEISAGKQRFSLRFVEADMVSERGRQVRDNITFKLKLCAF
ncbi:MAG: cell division protein ZapD [Thiothrix sp.]|nr:cell division protein ZapD [Thiothrix sp.]